MKTISVPLSSEAMERLDLDECLLGDLEELQLPEEHYAKLLQSGVIEKINSSLGKLIDENEDESIQGNIELTTSLNILTNAYEHTEFEILEKIITLNKLALKSKTGLFFYF
jgi:nitrate reductase beta subunit